MRYIGGSLPYVIESSDVGKPLVRIGLEAYLVSGFLGRILPIDVGKRLRVRSGVVEVENDEQRDKRLAGARR